MKLWRRTRFSNKRCGLASLLIPIFLIFGCPKSPIAILPPEAAQLVICKDGSPEETKSWNRIIDLAELEDDPFEIARGVRWAGGHLWRCRSDVDG